MNKTLHKKLTAKHVYAHTTTLYHKDDQLTGMVHEMGILRQAAQDLLEPRPQAIANILKLARNI